MFETRLAAIIMDDQNKVAGKVPISVHLFADVAFTDFPVFIKNISF